MSQPRKTRFDVSMKDIELDCGCFAYIQNEYPYRDMNKLCIRHQQCIEEWKEVDHRDATVDITTLQKQKDELERQITDYYRATQRLQNNNYQLPFDDNQRRAILAIYYNKKLIDLSHNK